MNFNINLEDELGRKLDHLCQLSGKKRNTIIREALETWLQQYSMPDWPESIKTFQEDPESIRFESYRTELKEPDEDWNAIQETLYLNSIPGMAESLLEGANTPIEDCKSLAQILKAMEI